MRARRRLLAVVDGRLTAIGHPNHHEPAAAKVSGRRMRDGEGKADGDGGVHGVAAVLQDAEPGARGVFVG